jgi:hypothetical protein
MTGVRTEVEELDEWGGEGPPHWSETRIARVVMGTGTVIVGLVVAVILGGTMRTEYGPVEPPYPSSSTTAVAASVPPAEPPALEPDDPVEPLVISLVDPAPELLTGSLASYSVRVCVSSTSAGVASDRVKVSLDGWLLRAAYYGDVSSPVVVGLDPEFPGEARLGKGQCVSGYVTFPYVAADGPHVIAYVSNRFEWSWYLG